MLVGQMRCTLSVGLPKNINAKYQKATTSGDQLTNHIFGYIR